MKRMDPYLAKLIGRTPGSPRVRPRSNESGATSLAKVLAFDAAKRRRDRDDDLRAYDDSVPIQKEVDTKLNTVTYRKAHRTFFLIKGAVSRFDLDVLREYHASLNKAADRRTAQGESR